MTKDEMYVEIRRLSLEAHNINPRKILKEQFKDCPHLVVYGAGGEGGHFVRFLKNALPEQTIDCFMDRNAVNKPSYLGYSVYEPDDERFNIEFREQTLVVLAVCLKENEYVELERQLRELGYKNFANAFFLCMFALHDSCSATGMKRDNFSRDIDEILTAFTLMSDDHSRYVFFETFMFHVMLDHQMRVLSPNMTDYVDVNVPFRNKYRNFVDCGAYTGDTLLKLLEWHRVEQYFGFEPDMRSFARLLTQADALHDRYGKAILLPLGVYDKNEFSSFFVVDGGASKMEGGGGNSTTIQCVRLDDILKGYDDLMIKMDIEGAEIEALHGAKRIITETKPDLAICVYHNVDDLWRIPIMLKEWVPEYKLYLRNHFICSSETVLYATVSE